MLKAENLAEVLFDHTPAGVAIFDRDLRLQRCNRIWRETISRYSPTARDEILPGKRWQELMPGTEEQIGPILQRVLAGESVREKAWRLTSGEVVSYWDIVWHPFLEEGQTTGLVVLATDVTERVLTSRELARARTALQEREERLDLVLHQTNDGIWDWDLETNEVYYSPRWKSILGYAVDEIPNRFESWRDLIHPDDLEKAQRAVQAYLEGRAPHYSLEHRLRHKDGSYRWILARGVALRDADGKPKRLVGSHTDITERKESEEHLRSLLENARDFAVYRLAVEPEHPYGGRVVMVSPSIREILGIADPYRFESWFENVHPDDRTTVEKANRRAWETGQPYDQVTRFFHVRKEKWIWVHTLSTPVYDIDGRLTHFNGLIIDVTEQKQAEAALQHQIAFESIITSISTRFINLRLEEVDAGIQRALQLIGEFTGVDRSCLFMYSGDRTAMSCTHEWCAAGIESAIDRMQAVPVDAFNWSNSRLMSLQVLHIPDVDALPPKAHAERREFEAQGVQALIAVPMAYRGAPVGFLCFEAVRSKKVWSDEGIRMLKIAGQIFVNALEHKRSQAIQAGQRQFLELLASGESLSETLHALVRIIEEQWPGMLGLVLLLDEDGKRLHHGASISLPQDYVDSIEGLEIGPMVGSCGTACYRGERVIVEDIATDPRWDGLRDLAVQYGLGACWSEPVFSTGGKVIATFAMYYHHRRAPTEGELRTIETAAHLVGVAVEHQRAREALQAAYQTLEQRVRERTRELTTLLEVSHDLASTLDLESLLDQILKQLQVVVDYSGAAVMTLNEDRLTLQAYQGPIPQEEAIQLQFPLEASPLNREVIRRREPVVIPDVRDDSPLARAFQRRAGSELGTTFGYVRSWMGVPLVVKDQVLGMLSLDHSEPNFFTTQHADLAMAFANQVAVAIENARLFAQAEQSAAVAVRSRLARDLHDAVSQTLFSASLIAEVLPRLWERNPQEGQRRLEELRELTRGALAEMRTLLLELRPAVLEEAELADLLRQLAESVTGRARVPVELTLEGECDMAPEVKVALYRIAQEALNNVAKHAGAAQASVSLRCDRGVVQLQVSDDGRGFDQASIPPESLGVGIMRERADAVGATLNVESQPGEGTQVRVIWQDGARTDAG